MQVGLSQQRGQAMVEYAVILAVLVAAGLLTAPFTGRMFQGIQMYLDVFFYALNVAVG